MSILNEKLKDFKYYTDKLPLYLQNSYGFIEHFRIWYEVLLDGVVNNADTLFELMDIFSPDYLETIDSADPDEADILDKLGSVYGVHRRFTVSYTDEGGVTQTKHLSLNNRDFLILIKAQIIKNYCNGTREQILDYYRRYVDLPVVMINDSALSATCVLILALTAAEIAGGEWDDVIAMFKSGILTVESVGIKYDRAVLDLANVLLWDNATLPTSTGWDRGLWNV